VIEAKDAWDAIELPDLRAETSKDTDDRTGKGKEPELAISRVKDAKARTVILGYCRPEALSRILHLKTAREQWKELEQAYLPIGRQQLSAAL
jgi:hypothetical protein